MSETPEEAERCEPESKALITPNSKFLYKSALSIDMEAMFLRYGEHFEGLVAFYLVDGFEYESSNFVSVLAQTARNPETHEPARFAVKVRPRRGGPLEDNWAFMKYDPEQDRVLVTKTEKKSDRIIKRQERSVNMEDLVVWNVEPEG
jgi:hypothetical protein